MVIGVILQSLERFRPFVRWSDRMASSGWIGKMEHVRENWIKMLEWSPKDAKLELVGGTKDDVAIWVVQLFGNVVRDAWGHGKEKESRG